MCLINMVKIWSWNISFEPCNRRSKLQEVTSFFVFGVFFGVYVGFLKWILMIFLPAWFPFEYHNNCIFITLENILLILSILRLFLPGYQVVGSLQDLSVGHKAARGKI